MAWRPATGCNQRSDKGLSIRCTGNRRDHGNDDEHADAVDNHGLRFFESFLFGWSSSPIRGDDRAPIDLAAVEQLIRLAHLLQWKMFNQHADFSCLGEADHFHELGYGAPVG